MKKRFGLLKVRFALEPDKWHKQYVCCQCVCGAAVRVRVERLLNGRQKSCGKCYRGDSTVRREARLKVPPKKRIAISRMGSEASKRVQHRNSFALDVARAAELLGVSQERIEILAKDGVLGHIYRKNALYVSVQDVEALLSEQARQKKRCRFETKLILAGHQT